MQCPNCKSSILPDDRFCESCGVPLVAEDLSPTTTCLKCGASDIDAEGYCTQCGFRNTLTANVVSTERIDLVVSQRLAGVSDRGFKHDRNEDYLALQSLDDRHHILVVCDGVSSSEQPEVAAKMAADTCCQYLVAAASGEDGEQAMKNAIAAAKQAVSAIPARSSEEENHDPPSTTIVAALVQGSNVTIGWLGDSRAYWISGANIQQLTQDDSWLNDMVSSGKLSEAEARQSPQAHAITRWLGRDAENDAIPSVVNFTIPSSGYLLLCSDGLWNYILTPSQLAELVQRYTAPDAIVLSEGLVQYALRSGGRDNITVAILSV